MSEPIDGDAQTIRTARKTYARGALDVRSADPDPFVQFRRWLDDALAAELIEPNAMAVATADAAGRPSARIVLLRGFDRRGFVFFTNYESRKGRELTANPRAALLFYWDALEREVRLEGRVERLEAHESDAYFASRPRGHRLSAWASRQSEPVSDRAALEAQMAEAERRFAGVDIPRPAYWGGYRVVPDRFEFWQGRPNRVHDRIEYQPDGAAGWRLTRLSP